MKRVFVILTVLLVVVAFDASAAGLSSTESNSMIALIGENASEEMLVLPASPSAKETLCWLYDYAAQITTDDQIESIRLELASSGIPDTMKAEAIA